jgi:hypothetical protein
MMCLPIIRFIIINSIKTAVSMGRKLGNNDAMILAGAMNSGATVTMI